MKKYLIILFLLFSTIALQAQELKWYTNISEAITVSNKKKKPLMLFFTGSDWCGWCQLLQKEVFVTPEFSKWANKSVVLVELDFPRRTAQSEELKMQNNQLQQFFQVQGYPTVYFAKGKVVGKSINFESLGNTGYVKGGPAAWIAVADPFVKKPVSSSKSKTKKA